MRPQCDVQQASTPMAIRSEAAKMAFGRIYGELIRQAQTLAYLDVLFLLAIFCGIMVPAVLLTRKVRPGAPAVAH